MAVFDSQENVGESAKAFARYACDIFLDSGRGGLFGACSAMAGEGEWPPMSAPVARFTVLMLRKNRTSAALQDNERLSVQ